MIYLQVGTFLLTNKHWCNDTVNFVKTEHEFSQALIFIFSFKSLHVLEIVFIFWIHRVRLKKKTQPTTGNLCKRSIYFGKSECDPSIYIYFRFTLPRVYRSFFLLSRNPTKLSLLLWLPWLKVLHVTPEVY